MLEHNDLPLGTLDRAALSADGTRLATIGSGGLVVWDPATRRIVHRRRFPERLVDVAFCGNQALVRAEAGRWMGADGAFREEEGSLHRPEALRVDRTTGRVSLAAWVEWEGMSGYDYAADRPVQVEPIPGSPLCLLCRTSGDGQDIIATLEVWDRSARCMVDALVAWGDVPWGGPRAVSPDGRHLACATWEAVEVWRVSDLALVASHRMEGRDLLALTWTEAGLWADTEAGARELPSPG